MKKAISIILVLSLFSLLFGCTKKRDAKDFSEVVFKSSNVKCEIIDDSKKDLEIFFVTNEKDLSKYSDSLSKICNLDTQGANGSFNEKIKTYNNEFFDDNYLILIKRYHTTNEQLTFDKITYKDKLFTVSSTLKTGGESDNSYRLYVFEISNDFYIKGAKGELAVSEDKIAGELEKSLIFSKGRNNYKVVSDEETINKIVALIAKENFVLKQTDPLDYTVSETDISIMYKEQTILLTNDFVALDSKIYAPNNDIKNKLSNLYKEISSIEETFEAPLDQ